MAPRLPLQRRTHGPDTQAGIPFMLRIRWIATALAIAVATAGCLGGRGRDGGAPAGSSTRSGTTAPAADPAIAIRDSLDAFNNRAGYALSFSAENAAGTATIQGDAAYRDGTAVYARAAVGNSSAASGDFNVYLFEPPDLYLRTGDGAWFVQSPWNQGYVPGQLSNIGIEQPFIDYADLAGALSDVTSRGVDDVGGTMAARYRARVALDQVPAFEGTAWKGQSADVDVWIARDTSLPVRLELGAGGPDAFSMTVVFSRFDESVTAPALPASARPLRDAEFPDAACIGDALANCLRAQTAIQGADSCAGLGRRVCLVPLGQISTTLVDNVVAYYRAQYDLTVTVLTPQAIPAEYEDPLRQQIDASRLMDYMGTAFPDDYRDPQVVLIGLTPVDLYDSTSHFRYVFGIKRTAAHPKAVMSSLRMDPQFYSERADDELYYARTRKLLTKFIGFLYYQLPLSSDPSSPMYDSILGPADVDRMREGLPVDGAR